jgi:hypothetical protein
MIICPRSAGEDRNLTITIYPSDAGVNCEKGVDTGITLTTNTIPRGHTCIGVEAIFGGDDRVGFLNDTSSSSLYDSDDDTSDLNPPGIHWYITSAAGPSAYDSAKNWSNIWFKQMNDSDKNREEGEVGRWVVTAYGNAQCERVNSTEFPWHITSCQTPGSCESSPYSVKGIKIYGLEQYDYDSYQTWAEIDAAPGLMPRASIALAFASLAFLLM